MFASTSYKGAMRAAASSLKTGTTTVPARAFSNTARVAASKKNKKDPYAMEIAEAARVLRAVEIEKPGAAYSLNLTLRAPKKGSRASNVRGRVVLPYDPRRSADVLLVFAEANSPSAKLAREAGVSYVGGTELFEPLVNGDIKPSKVLCTPGMLSSVTSRLARFLGPKGLMPTTRRGGVGEGEELVERIREAKGAIDWLSNSAGVVRSAVGRVSFTSDQVEANVRAVTESVRATLAANAGGSGNAMDEHLISNRQKKKNSKSGAGIERGDLQSSHGPRITLRDL